MARVDQKLIHGQVVVSWVPHLRINTIVVIDGEMAEDPISQKIMRLGLPKEISKVIFTNAAELAEILKDPQMENLRILLLFKNLAEVFIAADHGFTIDALNLGNLAYPAISAAKRLTETFYVTPEDERLLNILLHRGLKLYLQTMPKSKAHFFKLDLDH